MYTIRTATAADIEGIHTCWIATDYPDAHAQAQMLPLGVAPWLRHLVASGNVGVAEADGGIVGFAGTQTRGPVCYLADCFVLPAWQSKGVAKALLGHIQPPAGSIYATLASSDPRAASRYVRQGMTPRFPVFGMRSTARTGHADQPYRIDVCADQTAWHAADRRLLGYDRRVDVAQLLTEQPAFLVTCQHNDEIVGYAMVHARVYDHDTAGKWNIGPVHAATAAHAAAVHQSLVVWLHRVHGATEVTMRIPGPHPALPALLAAGVHTHWVELFCANQLWFDPQCYAPSGLL